MPGDTVTARGVVRERTEEDDRVKLLLDVWLENQRGDKVLVGNATGFVPDRPGSPPADPQHGTSERADGPAGG